MEAFAPDEAAFPEATLPRRAGRFPATAGFFIEAEGDVGAVPAIRGAHEALAGTGRELEGCDGEKGEKGEEKKFHGRTWKMKREEDAFGPVWSGNTPSY
jgi:hypothetical protein